MISEIVFKHRIWDIFLLVFKLFWATFSVVFGHKNGSRPESRICEKPLFSLVKVRFFKGSAVEFSNQNR